MSAEVATTETCPAHNWHKGALNVRAEAGSAYRRTHKNVLDRDAGEWVTLVQCIGECDYWTVIEPTIDLKLKFVGGQLRHVPMAKRGEVYEPLPMSPAAPTASYVLKNALEDAGLPIATNGPLVRQINSLRAARLLARYL